MRACVRACVCVRACACVRVRACACVQFKEFVSAPFCESIHLGEASVIVAMGKQFSSLSLQFLMHVLTSSSVFASSEVQEFVANVGCLAHHAQQYAIALTLTVSVRTVQE